MLLPYIIYNAACINNVLGLSKERRSKKQYVKGKMKRLAKGFSPENAYKKNVWKAHKEILEQ